MTTAIAIAALAACLSLLAIGLLCWHVKLLQARLCEAAKSARLLGALEQAQWSLIYQPALGVWLVTDRRGGQVAFHYTPEMAIKAACAEMVEA